MMEDFMKEEKKITSQFDHDPIAKLRSRELDIRALDNEAKRKDAEQKLIIPARDGDVSLLVVGDALGATTHIDLMLRAKELGIKVGVVFNASIINAVGVVGLELYKYGKTTSIVFDDDGWLPSTPYDVIKDNKSLGLHTLCLLDIKVAEPSREEMRKAIIEDREPKPMPPRYMTVKESLEVLLRIEEDKKEQVISKETLVIGVARLGHPDMKIIAGTVEELMSVDFGEPLHSLIIPGKLHHIEEEVIKSLRLN
jgi:diphthine synthase